MISALGDLLQICVLACVLCFASSGLAATPVGEPVATPNTASENKNIIIKQPGRLGVGVAIGPWQGIASLKYFFSEQFSAQISGPFGWDGFKGYFGFGVYSDFLYEAKSFAKYSSVELSWQLGPGLEFGYHASGWNRFNKTYNTLQFGFRINAGFQVLMTQWPIDFVVELIPSLLFNFHNDGKKQLLPNGTVIYRPGWQHEVSGHPINLSLKARYYF